MSGLEVNGERVSGLTIRGERLEDERLVVNGERVRG